MNQIVKTALQIASVGIAVVASGAFSAANAAQFSFTYSGTGISASGIITTDAAGTLITGITGQRNGVAITSLIAPGGFAGNDNVFIPSGSPAFLNFNGVSFNLASSPTPLNLFFNSSFRFYGEWDGSFSSNVTATFTPITQSVPEPSSLLGLAALGIVGVGAVLKGKKD